MGQDPNIEDAAEGAGTPPEDPGSAADAGLPGEEATPETAPDEREALLARLRDAMLASDPTIDPELVQGATLAELEASFERARGITERLRGVIHAHDAVRIPAGAPGRTTPAPLTAFEKIRDGLGRGS